ncbi:MAG TPA: PaaX family transcriptional regulator C-terminal domain-containing protein [Acidimicrobiales bacterium]|nr:PaaX family transcriptional regulator C-terminal domain-containing protein [Acidimicrobiales bacterium]
MQSSNGEAGGRAPADVLVEGERPLTARSVLASTLLGADPPELPVAHLVHMAGLFGINENRARVALSRMVTSGEATTDGSGRYRLAGRLLERQARQATSRAGWTGLWSGRWHVAVLDPAASAAEVRSERRRILVQSRLGELRQGVWTRPDNLPVVLDDVGVVARFTAEPEGDPVALAASLWNLDGWATRATALLTALDRLPVRDAAQLARGFVLSAAVLRHLQSDPLLPEELLPRTWPGSRLRDRYDAWDARYRAVLAAWGRAR